MIRVRVAVVCPTCRQPFALPAHLQPGGCDEPGPHDHPDPRLPEWFHQWLRGERHKAPPLRSWWSQRNLDTDAQDHGATADTPWHETNAGMFAA